MILGCLDGGARARCCSELPNARQHAHLINGHRFLNQGLSGLKDDPRTDVKRCMATISVARAGNCSTQIRKLPRDIVPKLALVPVRQTIPPWTAPFLSRRISLLTGSSVFCATWPLPTEIPNLSPWWTSPGKETALGPEPGKAVKMPSIGFPTISGYFRS